MIAEKKYGANSEYRMLHIWVEKQLGKPQKCEKCLTEDYKRFDWANISGEYRKEISDWKRLCRPCHSKMDWTHCRKGHELTVENVYKHPTGGNMCRICKVASRREYRKRTGK